MHPEQLKKEHYTWNLIFVLLFLALLAIIGLIIGPAERLKPIPVFDFIVLSLAVFRLTHLFVYDDIMDFVRDHFKQFETGPGKTISNLLYCPWCTGMWIALLIGSLYFFSRGFLFAFSIIALAGIGTLIDLFAEFMMLKNKSKRLKIQEKN